MKQQRITDEGYEQRLIELEREGWTALCTDRGAAYYREHLASGALMAFSFGVMTREQAVKSIEAAPPWSSFEIEDPRVVRLNEECGIVAYSVSAERDGEEPYSAVVSSAFVREDGDWKLAFHQQSPT